MRAGTEYDRKGRTGRVVALHGTGDVVEWGVGVLWYNDGDAPGIGKSGAFSAEN